MEHAMRRSKIITPIIGAMLFLFTIAPLSVISAPITVPFDETQLDGIVKDKDWLLVLGRAFFWDQQMGSDGGACGSCHFAAGADTRMTGQMNPAFRAPINGGAGDTKFGCTQGTGPNGRCITGDETASGGTAGPNYTFVEEDYPFRQLADPNVRLSEILINSNDVHSSAGSFDAKFLKAFHGKEACGKPNTDIFYIEGKSKWHDYHGKKLAKRAVEPRNTPSMINSGMLFTAFWDGRANNLFNGVGVFGMSDIHHDPNKRLIEMDGYTPKLTHLAIKNATIASLSVGPILDNLEMSCDGRQFADVARKILYTRPLRMQRIAKTDSTFGIYGPKGEIRAKKRGLKGKYKYYKLIQLAFEEKWWKGKGLWKIEDGKLGKSHSYKSGHTQMEINFPMFWGLALQKYQHSLVSDRSRFDIAQEQGCVDLDLTDPTELTKSDQCDSLDIWTKEEQLGRDRFTSFGPGRRDVVGDGNGGCIACHGGNMFTNAAFDSQGNFNPLQTGFGGGFMIDEGFQNTGANLFAQDTGRFGRDGYGYPVSWVRQLILEDTPASPDCPMCGQKPLDPLASQCNIVTPGRGGPIKPVTCDADGNYGAGKFDMLATRITMGGAMKSPSLRNVGLTPPYFHYGGYSNLRDIMDFYARGGSNRFVPEGCTPPSRGGPPPPNVCKGDTSGNGPLGQQEFGDFDPAEPGTNIAIGALDLSEESKDNIVKYMLSLSDDRVRCDAGPFDHPELIIFKGSKPKDRNYDYRADDIKVRLPAVGKEGYLYSHPELCIPNEGNSFAPGMGNRTKDKRKPTHRELLGKRPPSY